MNGILLPLTTNYIIGIKSDIVMSNENDSCAFYPKKDMIHAHGFVHTINVGSNKVNTYTDWIMDSDQKTIG